MSLQVWLPLNGDLHNQGLSSYNSTSTSANYTVINQGKIGKGIKCINAIDTGVPANGWDFTTTSISFGAWIKISKAELEAKTSAVTYSSTYNSCGGTLLGNHSYGGFGLRWVTNNIYSSGNLTDVHIYANMRNTSSNIIATSKYTIPFDTWTHVIVIFNREKETLSLYINGTLFQTKSSPIATYGVTGNIRQNNFYICQASWDGGNGNAMAGPWQLNDVRIYDHALSQKEVEEISKGLILHYKLNNNGLGNPNLIANSKVDGNWTYPTSSYSDKYSSITLKIPEGDTYTLSFDAKSTVNGDVIYTYYYSPNTTTSYVSSQGTTGTSVDGRMTFTLSTTWTRYWVVYHQSATTQVKHLICPRLFPSGGSGTISIKNVKFEEGSIPTPWIPATSDTIYSQFVGNNNVIYDSSGYNNNGTIVGSLEATTSSSRYSCSTKFDGVTSCIKIPYNEINPDRIFTVNLWFYKNALGSKGYETLFGGPSGFEMDTRAGTATSLSLYMASTRGSTVYSPLNLNKWTMITMARDGTNEFYYVDGELKKTIEAKSMPSGQYRIGAWASDTRQNYYGEISDFRIYATVLTAEQIKELYNTSATIDNNGNIYARELVEI